MVFPFLRASPPTWSTGVLPSIGGFTRSSPLSTFSPYSDQIGCFLSPCALGVRLCQSCSSLLTLPSLRMPSFCAISSICEVQGNKATLERCFPFRFSSSPLTRLRRNNPLTNPVVCVPVFCVLPLPFSSCPPCSRGQSWLLSHRPALQRRIIFFFLIPPPRSCPIVTDSP